VAVGDRELLDPPVRRRRVDPRTARVSDRRRGRDLRRARPARVAGWRPAPEDLPARSIDRERDPVRRRDEECVVRRPVDRDAVEVDRRGVDRSRQTDLLAAQRADVRRGDPGRERIVAAAARVPAEAGPVAARRRRDRLARAGDAPGRSAAARGEQDPEDNEQS
jgi:hypothetical protein